MENNNQMTKDKPSEDKPEKPLSAKQKAEIKKAWAGLNNSYEIPEQLLNQLKSVCGDGFILISAGDGTPVINSWFATDLASVGLITHGLRFFSSMHNYQDNSFIRGLAQESGEDFTEE